MLLINSSNDNNKSNHNNTTNNEHEPTQGSCSTGCGDICICVYTYIYIYIYIYIHFFFRDIRCSTRKCGYWTKQMEGRRNAEAPRDLRGQWDGGSVGARHARHTHARHTHPPSSIQKGPEGPAGEGGARRRAHGMQRELPASVELPAYSRILSVHSPRPR